MPLHWLKSLPFFKPSKGAKAEGSIATVGNEDDNRRLVYLDNQSLLSELTPNWQHHPAMDQTYVVVYGLHILFPLESDRDIMKEAMARQSRDSYASELAVASVSP